MQGPHTGKLHVMQKKLWGSRVWPLSMRNERGQTLEPHGLNKKDET